MPREEAFNFQWQWLGKPDYSQAAGYIASLPKEVKDEFRGKDESAITKMFFLCWLCAFRSGRGSAYSWIAQSTLGEDVGRSRRSISRALKRLGGLGLLSWRRRNPVQGKYRTCLYELGPKLLASLYARFSKTVFRKNHETKVSHNDLKKGNSSAAPNGAAATLKTKTSAPPEIADSPLDAESAKAAFGRLKAEIAARLAR